MWTNDTVYIASADILADTIPLNEIVSITEMNEDTDTAESGQTIPLRRAISLASQNARNQSSSPSDDGLKCVQVKTSLDGFNSGRIYHLKLGHQNPIRYFISSLSAAVHAAKKASDQKTSFERSQEAVRAVCSSFTFQMLMALLIVMVRRSHNQSSFSA